MSTIIALLRGVNIGNRRVRMAELRSGLEARGLGQVRTLGQAGNLVLDAPKRDGIAERLGAAASEIAGFEIGVVVRTAAELDAVVAANPYPAARGAQLHVVFLGEAPEDDPLAALDLASFAPEHATLVGCELYLHLPGGMGRSKLAAAVTAVSGRGRAPLATTRNWNTVTGLAAMTA